MHNTNPNTLLTKTFAKLKSQNKTALIAYIMAGDPTPCVTVDLMHALVEAGVDIIELGLPFSDPMADGPIIAAAAQRALEAGTSTLLAIQMVKQFRENDKTTPVVLMGYLNPVEFIGYDKFVGVCADAEVSGVLLVDLPPQESGDLPNKLAAHDIDTIFLLSPTTQSLRADHIINKASGFIYYVSLKGVTGSKNLDIDSVNTALATLCQKTDTPICVGFGIKDGKSAKALAKFADGVIIGSELVRHFATGDIKNAKQAAIDKIAQLRSALDNMDS